MSILKNLILVSLLPILFFLGAEEKTLKEARIDVSTGYYHLATVRLERLLKEYPKSEYRREILQLIIKSYVMSKREQEAIPHIRTFLKEFPNEAGSLDPKFLNLLSSIPQPPSVESVPAKTTPASPPEAESPSSTIAKGAPSGVAPPATATTVPPVQEPAVSAVTSAQPVKQEEKIGEKIEEKAPLAAPPSTTEPASEQKAEAPSAEVKQAPAPVISEEPKAAIAAESSTIPPPPPIKETHTGEVTPSVEKERIDYYTLSAGETVDRRELSRLLKKLRASGLKPLVREEKRSVVMHRLVAGCYSTSTAALKRKRELDVVIESAFIFREGDTTCAAAGSYRVEEIVEQERKRLAGKGVDARVVPFNMNLPFWSITAGRFPNAATAEKVQQRLSAGGLKLTIQPIKK